jgi:hypothetical protein
VAGAAARVVRRLAWLRRRRSCHARTGKVELSLDGVKWSAKPAAEGKGAGTHTIITFAPARARFIKITQTDAVENAELGDEQYQGLRSLGRQVI